MPLRSRRAMLSLALAALGCQQPSGDGAEVPASVASAIASAAPAHMTRLDVDYDGHLRLLGATVDAKPVLRPGASVKLTMYWQRTGKLPQDVRLFTHVLDAAGERVATLDRIGRLRAEVNGVPTLPPARFPLGKVVADEQLFYVPQTLRTDTIRVVAGAYRGDERLAVTSGPSDGRDRGIVATLPVELRPPRADLPLLKVPRRKASDVVVIDGRLTEAAWQYGADTGPFVNVATGEEDPSAPVAGKVRALWDDERLWLAFEVSDGDVVGGFPAGARDPHLWTRDTIEIMVDPGPEGDNRDYFEIQVGPQNLVFDSRFDDYNQPRGGDEGPFGHEEWSAELTSAVRIHGTLDVHDDDDGYDVELSIPWRSFTPPDRSPPKPNEVWRMNFYAMEKNSGVAWSPILRQGNFHKASRFGRVQFLDTAP